MNETLGRIADQRSDVIAGGFGVEDGEVDVGVGVGRVEEAAAGDDVRA